VIPGGCSKRKHIWCGEWNACASRELGRGVALAVPWAAAPGALAEAGELSGKVLWDCTNTPLPDMSGLTIGTTTSGGEEVAKRRRPIRLRKTHDHQVFAAFDR
jgi:predicted dinucleotide-binding enzyme